MILHWQNPTRQTQKSCGNLSEATENGAICIALWIIEEFTELKVVARSPTQTGFDYFLANKSSTKPYRPTASLEVSGLLKEKRGRLNQRVKEKIEQVKRKRNNSLASYTIVTEFSQLESKVVTT